jgi:hypothetical protein
VFSTPHQVHQHGARRGCLNMTLALKDASAGNLKSLIAAFKIALARILNVRPWRVS